jgi:pyruvate-formate lyase
MDPQLYERGLDCIREGRTYPMLYNDDVNVPTMACSFAASMEDAEQYVPNNCGEYSLDHLSLGSPNGSINYAKVLEITLNNGIDPGTGAPMGIPSGEISSFRAFDDLWDAFSRQAKLLIETVTDRMVHIHSAMRGSSAGLYQSLLFDDCLQEAKPLLDGARYVGLDVESHALISVADSLTAIRYVVYEKKLIDAAKLLDVLRSDFRGHEPERRILLSAPKYGNDEPAADAMAARVQTFVNATTARQASRLGLDFCLASHISVDAYLAMGKLLGATPDGRRAGMPVTNSSNPLAGSDRSGVTALLNSMAKLIPEHSGGQVQHLKLGRDLYGDFAGRTRALLDGFFAQGGCHLAVSVMGRDDLARAMEEPEKYPSLTVRIGGYSARFVSLPRELQEEILSRTMY